MEKVSKSIGIFFSKTEEKPAVVKPIKLGISTCLPGEGVKLSALKGGASR